MSYEQFSNVSQLIVGSEAIQKAFSVNGFNQVAGLLGSKKMLDQFTLAFGAREQTHGEFSRVWDLAEYF